MIAGYAQNGHCNEALELFHQTQKEGWKPDSVTIVSILPVSASLAALKQGKEIHDYIMRSALQYDIPIRNSLLDMYAKHGNIMFARFVFDRMPRKIVVSQNTMIAGYGIHGHGDDAIALFYQIEKVGFKLDYITFIALLSACSHVSLVDKGWEYFDCMSRDYNIKPRWSTMLAWLTFLGELGA